LDSPDVTDKSAAATGACRATAHIVPFTGDWLARLVLLALLVLCPALLPARASVANAPGANLEIALVTYGPGEVFW